MHLEEAGHQFRCVGRSTTDHRNFHVCLHELTRKEEVLYVNQPSSSGMEVLLDPAYRREIPSILSSPLPHSSNSPTFRGQSPDLEVYVIRGLTRHEDYWSFLCHRECILSTLSRTSDLATTSCANFRWTDDLMLSKSASKTFNCKPRTRWMLHGVRFPTLFFPLNTYRSYSSEVVRKNSRTSSSLANARAVTVSAPP